MNDLKEQRLRLLIVVVFVGSCMWILSDWVFVRFIHYHSQYRLLKPDDYKAQVISQEDYQELSNPKNREISLSNGTQMVKGDKWNSIVLPNYKAIDGGSKYVLVTLKGTAPFTTTWLTLALPILALSLIGLFISFSAYRGEQPKPSEV